MAADRQAVAFTLARRYFDAPVDRLADASASPSPGADQSFRDGAVVAAVLHDWAERLRSRVQMVLLLTDPA